MSLSPRPQTQWLAATTHGHRRDETTSPASHQTEEAANHQTEEAAHPADHHKEEAAPADHHKEEVAHHITTCRRHMGPEDNDEETGSLC